MVRFIDSIFVFHSPSIVNDMLKPTKSKIRHLSPAYLIKIHVFLKKRLAKLAFILFGKWRLFQLENVEYIFPQFIRLLITQKCRKLCLNALQEQAV